MIETTDSSGKICFTANYYAGVYPDLFVGARYYNPRLGRPDALTDTGRSALSEPHRFMSPDPLAGSIDDPQSLNGYSYILNNPTSSRGPRELSVTSRIAAVASLALMPASPALAAPSAAGSQGLGTGEGQELSGAQNAEAAFEEFRLDYLIFRIKATNPYSNSFGEAVGALGPTVLGSTHTNAEGQITPTPTGNTGLGGMLGGSPLVPFDNPTGDEILSALQVDFFNTSNMSDSFTGVSANLQAAYATYIYAFNSMLGMHYGFSLGSMNGNLSFAVDPGFPGFDVNMFFGGGGGFSGHGECGVGGWNDVCSL